MSDGAFVSHPSSATTGKRIKQSRGLILMHLRYSTAAFCQRSGHLKENWKVVNIKYMYASFDTIRALSWSTVNCYAMIAIRISLNEVIAANTLQRRLGRVATPPKLE